MHICYIHKSKSPEKFPYTTCYPLKSVATNLNPQPSLLFIRLKSKNRANKWSHSEFGKRD